MKVRLLLSGCFAACGLFVGGMAPSFAQSETNEESDIAEVVRNQDSPAAVQDELIREVLVADPTSDSGVAPVVERILYQDQVTPPADSDADSGQGSDATMVYKVSLQSLLLQQQMQQLSVTMKSLSRQLESLEKLENTIRSEALPTEAKLHAAAESFGLAIKEHLQALNLASERFNKLRDTASSQLQNRAANGTTDPNVIVRPTYDLPLSQLRPDAIQTELLQALIQSQSARQSAESPLAAQQAQREVMAVARAMAEKAMAEKAKLAAKSDELREQIQGEVARVKSAEEELLAAARAAALKAQLSEEKREQATDDAASQRLEKLESRLERIEALLERLAGEKTVADQQDDQ
jgi:hypothetical protein